MSIKVIQGGITHKQTTAAKTWYVNHKLGRHVIVDVFIEIDGAEHKILPLDVQIVDDQNCAIHFSEPRTGVARIG